MIEVPPPTGIRMDCVSGTPLCGKTTIRKILQYASCYLAGFHWFDSSDHIIEWHKDPANNSPFHDAFIAANKLSSAGNLINDTLMNNALYFYLHAQMKLHGDVRHVTLFGFPRKRLQIKAILDIDPNAGIFFIDATQDEAEANRLRRIEEGSTRPDDQPGPFAQRWKRCVEPNGTRDELMAFGKEHPGQFTLIPFSWKLGRRVAVIANKMNVEITERTSIIKQINTAESEACRRIEKIDGPRIRVHPTSPSQNLQPQASLSRLSGAMAS